MTNPDAKTDDPPAASDASPTPGQPVRSEGLLPADEADTDLFVAEEVAFDLQSDATRRVGSMPRDTPTSKPAEAVAEALAPDGASLKDAVDGAVPPSPSP